MPRLLIHSRRDLHHQRMGILKSWEQKGEAPHTLKQRKMLNAVCGDLAKQIDWHGCRMDKDDWRHFLCSVATKAKFVPGYRNGEGEAGFVVLGKSSLKTTKDEMSMAINIGLNIGNEPSDQGLKSRPVAWCDAVLLGCGDNPNDYK